MHSFFVRRLLLLRLFKGNKHVTFQFTILITAIDTFARLAYRGFISTHLKRIHLMLSSLFTTFWLRRLLSPLRHLEQYDWPRKV